MFTRNKPKRKTRLGLLIAKNKRLLKRLKEVSFKDPLTDTYNYQYLIERLRIELENAKQYMFPLSVIMIDIDYFNSINDIYGYRVGDNILKQFARYLKQLARTEDVIIRYVGATFVMLLPNTHKDGAVALGQRFCESIQRHGFNAKRNKVKLKVSIGVANFPANGIDTVSGLIDAGDKAIRKAKEKGGNRVVSFEAAVEKKRHIIPPGLGIRKIDQTLLESIYSFAKAIEARDYYTSQHAEEMVRIVRDVGRGLGLSKNDIANLEYAAVLHDLGKIGIDDRILRKPGKLTRKEFEEIKKHPRIGAEILRPIHFLKNVVPLVLYHHERYDGKGYVEGLKGNKIPLGARVLAIADVYQALISKRPYRKAYTKKQALKIIKKGSGTQFDPAVVRALLRSQGKKV